VAVGARPLNESLDAAVLVTLDPGVYSVTVHPWINKPGGETMLEIFEVDASRNPTFAPVITYVPKNQQALPGNQATFGVDVVAKPAAAVTYQWRKGGVNLSDGTTADGTNVGGATGPVLTLSNVHNTDAGSYDVVVSNGVGSPVTSPARTLKLLSEFHSADTNLDRRISVAEVTRVIQLYNYRSGANRTGEYRSQTSPATEDGYAPGPGPITMFHSADFNRDGRIDAGELLRVIELFNYRDGSVRTGDYHVEVVTEDGFAPGPVAFNDPV
jgi:hypothetical protein